MSKVLTAIELIKALVELPPEAQKLPVVMRVYGPDGVRASYIAGVAENETILVPTDKRERQGADVRADTIAAIAAAYPPGTEIERKWARQRPEHYVYHVPPVVLFEGTVYLAEPSRGDIDGVAETPEIAFKPKKPRGAKS